MEKTTRKQGPGGKREGAGRPPAHPEGYTTFCGVTIPAALLVRLDVWATNHSLNRSEAVTEAIRRLVG